MRDRELLDKSWQELRLEKEKVGRATLRIQQQEEQIKSTTKVSEASALQFTAGVSHPSLSAESQRCPGRGTGGAQRSPAPGQRGSLSPASSAALPCSSHPRSTRKGSKPCKRRAG